MIYYSAIPIFSPNQNQNDKSGFNVDIVPLIDMANIACGKR
jgi:hypothetical protein